MSTLLHDSNLLANGIHRTIHRGMTILVFLLIISAKELDLVSRVIPPDRLDGLCHAFRIMHPSKDARLATYHTVTLPGLVLTNIDITMLSFTTFLATSVLI